jgi:hypothetical protein
MTRANPWLNPNDRDAIMRGIKIAARKRRRNDPEGELQRAVFGHIRHRGAAGVVAFHVPNGGKRSIREAVAFKRMGVLAGVPDVIAIKDGRCYALELKPFSSRKPSGAQVKTMADMESAGAIVGVAYGLTEALSWLERHGILEGKAA